MNTSFKTTEHIRFLIHWPLLVLTFAGWLFSGIWAVGTGVIIMGLFHTLMTAAAFIPRKWGERLNNQVTRLVTAPCFERLAPSQFLSFVAAILLVTILVIVSPESGPFYRQTLFLGAMIMIGALSNLLVSLSLVRFLYTVWFRKESTRKCSAPPNA
jgi:hypothetical protein